MGLTEYRRKRRFQRTPEPSGCQGRSPTGRLFVVQKHAARRLHYDLRLELDGVLKSWAVPKGPSLEPGARRLAVAVEDHPLEYGGFEGIIPEGEYGGGTVMLWDRGAWEPVGDPREGYERGRLKFRLEGEKLRGGFMLVRMSGRASEDGKNWLLIKERDVEARPAEDAALHRGASAGREQGRSRERLPRSVASGRSLEEIRPSSRSLQRRRVAAPASSRSSPDRRRRSRRGRPAPTDRARAGLDPGALPGARSAPLPERFAPQLATLVKQAPAGEDWLHELKLDGYRVLARREGEAVRLLSRRGLDWTARFPSVASAVEQLPVREALLDGEVVVLAPDGTSDFQALQNAGPSAPGLTYFVFDLPFCGGYDLRAAPLLARKQLLAALLASAPGELRLSDHVRGHGEEAFAHACSYALEGIVSKRATSRYESRRTASWVKVKCLQRQELVVGGYTDPAGGRSDFGALLLGLHDERGRLVYCGRVGTGFTAESLARLGRELHARAQPRSPFAAGAPRGRGLHWVRPELVAEVEFAAWTADGLLRHPSFKGLREDVPAAEVRREQARALR